MDRRKHEYKGRAYTRTAHRFARQNKWLLQRAIDAGVDQFKCKGVGTAYKSITTRVSCADWPEFHRWVLKTKNVSALEQRVSKTFVKEYREANKDNLPPGVTIFEEAVMNVRRSPQPKGDSE